MGAREIRLAIENGDEPGLRKLLEGGAWRPWRSPAGERRAFGGFEGVMIFEGEHLKGVTLLMFAAQRAKPGIARMLLEMGADPKALDKRGRSALHHAGLGGSAECVRLLAAAGADLEGKGKDGQRPAHLAAAEGSAEVLFALADLGADLSAKTEMGGGTPLHVAAENGCVGAIRALAASGADLESRNRAGETPLIAAARSRRAVSARALLEAGASAGARDDRGMTALMAAAERGWEGKEIPAIQALLEAGADLEQRRDERGGAISVALAMSPSGVSALDIAEKNGQTATAEAIRSAVAAAQEKARAPSRELEAPPPAEPGDSERGTPEAGEAQERPDWIESAAQVGAQRMIRILRSLGRLGEGERELEEFSVAARVAAEAIAREMLERGFASGGGIEQNPKPCAPDPESARIRQRRTPG